ncbi:MAG: right-handed parallel beta-helix repeat-containing protein [Candidatus Odinarchaeota archaeon]
MNKRRVAILVSFMIVVASITAVYFMFFSPGHEPIIINSNSDFEAQGWAGNGTEASPYLIENLVIRTTEMCISIQNTNAFFIIRNCILTCMPYTIAGGGIYLSEVSNGLIEGCTVSNKNLGIGIQSCDHCVVSDCILSNGKNGGCWISDSSYCVIVDCTIQDIGQPSSYGFSCILQNSEVCSILNCTISRGGIDGVSLLNSLDCSVRYCTITNNGENGVHVDDCTNCAITYNIISFNVGDGIQIETSSSITTDGNEFESNGGDDINIVS